MTRLLRAVRAGALLLLLAAPACAPAASPALAGAQAAVVDRLYFGRGIPGGGTVSAEEWTAFLREVVTPRFPAGLTVWAAEGQWRDAGGAIVREPSWVLELVHPADPAVDRALEEVVASYRARFRQEAVLHLRHGARLRF